MKKFSKTISAMILLFVMSLISAKAVYAGWIAPAEGGSQAEIGKLYQIQYETGVWHNTTQYCDIRVSDPDGTIVHSETFQFSGIGDIIKTSFIPSKLGKYTITAQCYYYITQTFWNGLSSSSYKLKTIDNTKTETLDVVKELPKTSSDTKASSTAKTIKTSAGTFTVKNGSATLKAPKSKALTKLTIPATIKANGKAVPVTAIAKNAFKGMDKLTTVTIGKNVKSIGAKAFYGCKKLKKITIKSTKLTKKTVGSKAFTGIYKKAVIKCPKAKKAAYKKILLKKGMKKTVKFK